MSRGTTHHSIRVEAAVWDPAKAKAERLDTNLSAVIRDYLQHWAEEPDPDYLGTFASR